MSADLQYVLDYIAIREVSVQYNRFTDAGEGKRFAQLFTEDGELDIAGDRVFRGHGELEQVAVVDSVAIHSTTDPLIDIDGDVAHQTSRVIFTSKPPDGSRNEFLGTGLYIDELHRTPDGWRFHRRRIEADRDTREIRRQLGSAGSFDELAKTGVGSE